MTVPSPTPLDTVAPHRPVTRNNVFRDRRKEVAVVRKACGKGRTVEEPERLVRRSVLDRLVIQVVVLLVAQDAAFHRRKIDLTIYAVEDTLQLC